MKKNTLQYDLINRLAAYVYGIILICIVATIIFKITTFL
ncbi:hypothetical protein IMSAG049_00190 [Clostridiales bacterium]|nr:hypothetical protein IMSAG049_00190 [Clostridiales bacterium]